MLFDGNRFLHETHAILKYPQIKVKALGVGTNRVTNAKNFIQIWNEIPSTIKSKNFRQTFKLKTKATQVISAKSDNWKHKNSY